LLTWLAFIQPVPYIVDTLNHFAVPLQYWVLLQQSIWTGVYLGISK
jgi:hypothetical protein